MPGGRVLNHDKAFQTEPHMPPTDKAVIALYMTTVGQTWAAHGMVLQRTVWVSPGSLSEMQILNPISDPLNENLHFSKIPKSMFIGTLKSEKAGVLDKGPAAGPDLFELDSPTQPISSSQQATKPLYLSISSSLRSHHSASGFTHPSKQRLFCAQYMPGPVLSEGATMGNKIRYRPIDMAMTI